MWSTEQNNTPGEISIQFKIVDAKEIINCKHMKLIFDGFVIRYRFLNICIKK